VLRTYLLLDCFADTLHELPQQQSTGISNKSSPSRLM
jgi:hypothetical protein